MVSVSIRVSLVILVFVWHSLNYSRPRSFHWSTVY